MKKAIMIVGAALLLAGCSQDQGTSSDTYSTGKAKMTNTLSTPSTNQGAATPGGTVTNSATEKP